MSLNKLKVFPAFLLFLLLLLPLQSFANNDPLEPLNRFVFKVNDTLDVFVVVPVTRVYQAVTPKFVETRVVNFFDNLNGLTSIVNSLGQLKIKKSVRHTGQFVINSTVGLLGFFDVARHVGLEEEHEDFGQTLAFWNIPSGPYIVLPIFGPSTIRDSVGLGFDQFTYPVNHAPLNEKALWSIYGMDLISARAELLKYEAMITGDRYEMIKELYLQSREYDILDGKIIDEFSIDENDGDGEFLDESF